MLSLDKFCSCFYGLAIGDAHGAPFEGGLTERFIWQLIGKTREGKCRYTDDTQMSIDLATSFLSCKSIDQQHLATTFANSYRWSRGYGPAAAQLLKKINAGATWQTVNRKKFKLGSFGNGAAMRAPILALCFAHDQNKLKQNIVAAAEITHAHPFAIEGSKLIALSTYAALHDWQTDTILQELPNWCESTIYKRKIDYCIQAILSKPENDYSIIKRELGNGITASESSVTAIYFSLTFRKKNFEHMLSQIAKLGGDTDTIGAMAGAIWGAFNNVNTIGRSKIESLENSEQINQLAKALHTAYSKNLL